MEERNDIVIYKSDDGLVKMEAMVDPVNETIWASQKAIAALFDVTVPNISYHFKKIFESGELDAGTVVKDFLITAQSGARGTSDEKVKYYNLDAIISIGYRVNSFRATKFRIWATQVLKQYMLKGFAINRNASTPHTKMPLKPSRASRRSSEEANCSVSKKMHHSIVASARYTRPGKEKTSTPALRRRLQCCYILLSRTTPSWTATNESQPRSSFGSCRTTASCIAPTDQSASPTPPSWP